MDSHALEMTAELAAELAASDRRRADPRGQRVRFTNLHKMGQSPAHCLESFQWQNEETLATRIGSGAHALLLGKRLEVFDKPAKKGKGKAPRNGGQWEDFKKANEGATIVNRKEHDTAHRIADAVRANRDAEILLLSPGVIREQTIEWDWLGRACRSTPDARHQDWLVEFKTTRCAQPDRFVRDATYRAYHGQVAFYRLAIEWLTGIRPPKCYIVAVESAPPHAVTVLEMAERAIEFGEQMCRGWMERLLVCETSGEWPGYCQSITAFDIPDPDVELQFADDSDEDSDA